MPTKELTDQSFENIPPQEEIKRKKGLHLGQISPRLKMALGGAISLGVLLILLFLLKPYLLKLSQTLKPPLPPVPQPTVPKERPASPSAYATDSAILRIEQELDQLEEALLSTDLKETSLSPPLLDMNVKFK